MVRRAIYVAFALAVSCILVGCPTCLGFVRTRPAEAAAIVPLDMALRTVDSVEDFSDYVSVVRNRYATDVTEAFDLGLVVGKYDEHSSYYDPDTLVTTGEMANILARNLGAPVTVQGYAAVSYLGEFGVTVGSGLSTSLSLAELRSMALQIQGLGTPTKADLLVIRQAVNGTLAPDYSGGITRAHAVAMFDDRQANGTGVYTNVAGGEDSAPSADTGQQHKPSSPSPASSGAGGQDKNKHESKRNADSEREKRPIEPVFVLTG